MEVDEIHCNFPGITNGAGSLLAHVHKMDEEEDAGRDMNKALSLSAAAAVDLGGGLGRLYGWPSSRIVRVSRASGGKDRHSKVLTSKGLRDRRVRLSVNTAIQFYDLQDRLGYDQPSKAVEWLLKAAAASIAELPPMSSPFPDTPPKQLSDEKRSTAAASDHLCFESPEVEMDGGDPRFSQATTKSSSSAAAACSSTSETSLTRSESRIKARERAKGRVADRDQKESEPNPISQTTSFTELLSGGGRNWSSAPMDYFTSGLFRPPQMHEGNQFTFGSGQQELQHISFLSDLSNHHHNHNGDNYNLNFAISSSSADNSSSGFSRGTLQSNSSPPPTYANNINSDGFYIGTTAAAAAVENHHRFQSGYYGTNNNNNNNEQKGKGKN